AGVPVWAVASTLEVLRYALLPFGQVLAPVVVIGAARLGRRDPTLLAVLLAPLGLALVAALLDKYPYGGARVCAFAAPTLVLLVAEGVPACWDWLRRRSRLGPPVLAIVLALPAAQTADRVVVPCPRASSRAAFDYVDAHFRDGDLIASDHWEVLYYTRGREDRLCQPTEIADPRPARVWVLTGTDPGVGER